MDWNAAIEKHRAALKQVLAMLVAMAGPAGFSSLLAGEDGSASRGKAGPPAEPGEECSCARPTTLPRHLHRAILRLLRPAESAVRRLIVVAARGLVVALPPARPRRPRPAPSILRNGIVLPQRVAAARAARPCLPLADRLPRWHQAPRPASGFPRISVPGLTRPVPLPRAPAPDDPIDATRLALRLGALARALDDLPREARRFARWRARGADISRAPDGAPGKKGRAASPVRRVWPLRPGSPPGARRRSRHAVHDVLGVVHGLAFWALEQPDTS
ncbi:hypothetical protein ABUE31_05410 [Mesorhizobium sp. ZMM04-5]|uniref:Uncharacterized protein n=1 Tax=Mesorhizobium marinum TaxID=3228790 RepID=A0ABV3QWH6_9HYPH